MQAKVFSIEKTHQHILFCSEIQSFVSITDRNYKTLACPYNVSVLTIESVARNLVNYLFAVSKVSGTITRKSTLLVCAPLATSSLTFSTRNSILETRDSRLDTRDSRLDTRDSRLDTRDSRLDTRDSKLSSIESRGSRLEGLSTYF